MPNAFASLPVPAGDGVGAWVDTSGMAPGKTISVDGGNFSGTLFVECSNDGQASAAPAPCSSFTGLGGKPAPQDIEATLQFMRIRRTGSTGGPLGSPTVSVGAEAATSNVFGAMVVPVADGNGTPIDLSGGGAVNSFNVAGPFSGQVVIDISTDAGATFSPVIRLGQSSITTPGSPTTQTILGVIAQARVRREGSILGQPIPTVSVGSGGEAGGGGAFPGYGGAPPAVATAGAGGGAGTASRSDHTHQGVPTLNGQSGAQTAESTGGTIGVTTPDASHINFEVLALPTGAFGGAPPAVAASSAAGAAGTASRSDHTHQGVASVNGLVGSPSVTTTKPGDGVTPSGASIVISGGGLAVADSVNTAGATLAALSATNFPLGNTLAFVKTTGRYYILQTSAFTVDHVNVETASGRAGAQWVGLFQIGNPIAQAQTAWFVDGQNSSGTASDENNGLTNTTPLLTMTELARRVYGATYRVAVTYNVMSDCLSTDSNVDFGSVDMVGGTVTILGVPGTPVYSGTVSTFTPRSTGPAADDNEMTDATLPVSFTASGTTANGLVFVGTTGAAACYWYIAKDLGTKTARVSDPTVTTGATLAAPQVGSAYTVAPLPKIRTLNWANVPLTQSLTLKFINDVDANDRVTGGRKYVVCWTGAKIWSGGSLQNVAFASGTNFFVSGIGNTLITSVICGVFFGSGGTAQTVTGANVTLSGTMFQGARWISGSSGITILGGRVSFYDCTSLLFDIDYWSNMLISVQAAGVGNTGYGIGGMNNTDIIISVRQWSTCAYAIAPAMVAGMTSNTSPLRVGSALFPVSSLPILKGPSDEGIFLTDVAGTWQQLGTSVAAGAVAVAITNAPAGSPATPVRYATFPDGQGGTWTFPSLT